MRRLRYGISKTVLVLSALAMGCGGGQSTVQPPPSPQDFTLALSSGSVSLSQGGTSSLSISIGAQNGFSGPVQVTLAGLPSGVSSSPASPFSVAAGASAPVVLGASPSAATGAFSVSAEGTSGGLSHSATLDLTVQSGSSGNLPRTAYARTDSVSILDDPPGEAHHRHIAYDAPNKHVFIANRAMNRVEVFSTADRTRVAQIAVAGASSADLSTDGGTIWIGTVTEQAVAIDAATVQVKARYAIQPLEPIPNTVFDRPEELLAMARGKLMMRLRQANGAESLLALWDPTSNNLTNLTSVEPQLFQNGLGAMVRSGDGSKLLVAANDSSGEVAVFDANGNAVAGPRGLGTGTIPMLVASPDGSYFAVEFVSNGAAQLLLLDSALNQVASAASPAAVQGMTFSRDGKSLYVSASASPAPEVSVFNATTLQLAGEVPDVSVEGMRSEIETADESQLIFGLSNRGVSFIDASAPANLPVGAPVFAAAPVAVPAEGQNAGGTTVSITGQGFESSAQAKFGAYAASNVAVSGSTEIQAASPASVANGAVNISAYFPSGWLAVAPDAFSYGPQILKILPNAGAKTGADTVQIYGYGFGSDASKISVSIGGTSAAVQQVEGVTSILPSLALGASYPFPIERITLQTPAGTPAKADVVVTSLAGSATASRGFEYLQSAQVYAKAGLYKFLFYDQTRQWIYLSNIDHVDVFDLAAGVFHATGLLPPGGPPPDAGLRGLSLTPDGTQLAVADFGAQNVYLLNPDDGTGTSVHTGGVAGFTNSGPALVAATSTQNVFVSLSGEGGGSGTCSGCLSQMDLTASPPTIAPATQPEVSTLTGTPLLRGNTAGSQVFVCYGTTSSPVALWDAGLPNQFTTLSAGESASDAAISADGTTVGARAAGEIEVRDSTLALATVGNAAELEQLPGRVFIPGIALHPSGALLYVPFLTGPAPAAPPAIGIRGGIDILDARTGQLRLRIFLPEPFAALSTDTDGLHGQFLTLDENGQRIFALTTSGLTVVQLSSVPLGVATVSPASGAAAGGVTVTIRGSGFQSGATVNIGGKSASATFKDMNTLTFVTPSLAAGPQQLVITNPSSESVSLDAAFVAN